VTSDQPLGLPSRSGVPEQLKSGKQNKTYSNCAGSAPPTQERVSEQQEREMHTMQTSKQFLSMRSLAADPEGERDEEQNLRTAKCLHTSNNKLGLDRNSCPMTRG
jgi:hypothetical protein